MKKWPLHWKILLGMVLGIGFGIALIQIDGGVDFSTKFIKPFGVIFIKLLKLIAIPLIVASLIKGISDLKNISKFRNIGLRTIVTYVVTTVIAISIGLILVNLLKPGEGIDKATIDTLTATYANDSGVQYKISEANRQQSSGPLQFIEDMVPDNAIGAMSDNSLMLQVILFTIFLGISMLLVGEQQAKPLKKIFDSLNAVVLKMVDLIMLSAPYAVFALLANVVVSSDNPDLLLALLKYAVVVLIGLVLMVSFYSFVIFVYVKKSPFWFLSGISPAQLLAF